MLGRDVALAVAGLVGAVGLAGAVVLLVVLPAQRLWAAVRRP